MTSSIARHGRVTNQYVSILNRTIASEYVINASNLATIGVLHNYSVFACVSKLLISGTDEITA